MGLRDRREERREDRRDDRGFGRGPATLQYRMREKLASIGDDFWIEDSAGGRAYKVNGKALRLRKTLVLEDPAGNELLKIQDRPVRIRDVMEIEGPDGQCVATVKKAMITPLRQRYVVNVKGGPDLDVQGNIVDHEYTITSGGNKIAEVSRRWFRVRDTYGVEIQPGNDVLAILVATVCLEQMG